MPNVEYITVPVEQLRKNEWNSNQVSVENEAKIKSSIIRNGMFKPIIVRQVAGLAGYEIIGGEHRWEQSMELGYTEVPVANLGEIDDKAAKEIGVIDNARYGIDDILSLGEILKDIDDGSLQDYLPYGDTDLNAIFSSSDIALDDLEIDEDFEKDKKEESEEPVAPVAKTDTIMRFKVPIGDAEKLAAIISRTRQEQGFTDGDDLTNAGDALIHLIIQKSKPEEV